MADVLQATQTGDQLDQSKQKQQSPASTDTGVQMDQEMDQGSAKSDSANTTSVVNNTQALTEQEAEQVLAPEDYVAEEARLREERAKAGADPQAAPPAAAETCLSNKRMKQLDELLHKTGMYTQFLTEQMKFYQAKGTLSQQQSGEDNDQAEAGTSKGKGGKRKRGGNQQANKKQKVSMADAAAKGAAAAAAAAKVVSAEGTVSDKQKALLPLIEGQLREYQLAGVTWLISLYQNGLNGILADQMGLGKTVQTISLLSYLRSNGINGPFLIIAPLSTLKNWANEVRRFCPSMPVLEYHGNGAKARAALRAQYMPLGPADPDFPCIVSTYEIVMADITALARYHWKYIVVDEGHRLKNFNCKLLKDLKTLSADNKLLLTGTPLQNNLAELWSLLNFLLPQIFSKLDDFKNWFEFSDAVGSDKADEQILAAEQRNNVVSKLHNLLKPFMLRRLKADVEIALPRKQEMLLYAPMSEEQKKINQQLLDKTLGDEMAKLAQSEGTGTGNLAKINNVLMQMRKNCNHPDLITSAFTAELDYPPPDVLVAQAGKMGLLDRLLKRLKAGGHKVLIFSQMTKMLDLLESYLSQSGHNPCRIDGSMRYEDRQQAIEDFNTKPDSWIFLLSTRAGGLGINLTAADTVIIYDSDWNPHQDLQAMDRCHRIGQNKPVLVFRLATSNSVEGKMLRRACDKMALERLVIRKGVFKEVLDAGNTSSAAGSSKSTSMSAAELLALLRSDISMDDIPQSGVASDEMLDTLLDRSWMVDSDRREKATKAQQQTAAGAAGVTLQSSSKAKNGKRGRPASSVGAASDTGSDGTGNAAGAEGSDNAAAAASSIQKAAAAETASGREVQRGLPYPATGVGYEVIQALEDNSLLSNVNHKQ